MAKKKPQKKKKSKQTAEAEAAYQSALDGLCKIINDAKANGVDFALRTDLFSCSGCGAYEDVFDGDEKVVCLKDDSRAPDAMPFTVVNEKETSRTLKSGILRFRTTYAYICGVCGAYQTEVFIHEFDD